MPFKLGLRHLSCRTVILFPTWKGIQFQAWWISDFVVIQYSFPYLSDGASLDGAMVAAAARYKLELAFEVSC